MTYLRTSLLIGILIGYLYAQEGTFKLGALLLPQNTWLLNQDDTDAGPELDYEVTWGFAGGLSAAYNFTNYVGVGLDILYSSQGQKYKGSGTGYTMTARTSLNYLKLPLLLRFNSDPAAPLQFSFFLGPQANILLSYTDKQELTFATGARATTETRGTEQTFTIGGLSEKEKLSAPAYRSFLFGAALGLGVGVKLTDEILLSLHFRGDYAFGDAENKEAHITHGIHEHEYWEQKPKYKSVSHTAGASEERAATTALTGGLMIGIIYNLPLR